MKKIVFLALVTVLSSCKQASFLTQRYTHYGHAKPNVGNATRLDNSPSINRREAQIAQEQVVTPVTPGPSQPKRSRDLPPSDSYRIQPGQTPIRRIQNESGIVASAKQAGGGTWVVKSIKAVPDNIKKLTTETSMGIPIISPLLRLVFLILLIVLIVALIFLFI